MPDLELSPMPTHCWVCGDALPGLAVEGMRNLIAGGFDPEVHLPPVYGTAFDTCGDKYCEGPRAPVPPSGRGALRPLRRSSRRAGAMRRLHGAGAAGQVRTNARCLRGAAGRARWALRDLLVRVRARSGEAAHRSRSSDGRAARPRRGGGCAGVALCGGCNLMLGGLERYADAAAAQMRAKAAALYLATPPASEGGRWLRGIAALSDADA